VTAPAPWIALEGFAFSEYPAVAAVWITGYFAFLKSHLFAVTVFLLFAPWHNGNTASTISPHRNNTPLEHSTIHKWLRPRVGDIPHALEAPFTFSFV
jgi:hypothetical protein